MPLEAPAGSAAQPALAVEEITTTGELERLESEWTALWVRCPTATPFQSPAWLVPWWRHIGHHGPGDLWTLALRHEGRLVGLAPLYVYTQPDTGRRDLFLLGIATTDYLDGLFAPGWERAGTAAVIAHLGGERHRWDVCDWQQLRPGSPLLAAAVPPAWRDEIAQQEPCPALQLPGPSPKSKVRGPKSEVSGRREDDEAVSVERRRRNVDELAGCVPAHALHNLRYYRRRAERAGPLQIEAAGAANLSHVFDALLQLHRARWSVRGEPGVLADEAVQRAHREALPALHALGVLRLYVLHVGKRLAAVYYGFADGARAYYYLSGFDPALSALSLGTLLVGHAIGEAIAEGATTFDFLRGRERYKYLWGAQDAPTYRRQLQYNG